MNPYTLSLSPSILFTSPLHLNALPLILQAPKKGGPVAAAAKLDAAIGRMLHSNEEEEEASVTPHENSGETINEDVWTTIDAQDSTPGSPNSRVIELWNLQLCTSIQLTAHTLTDNPTNPNNPTNLLTLLNLLTAQDSALGTPESRVFELEASPVDTSWLEDFQDKLGHLELELSVEKEQVRFVLL
jgi:hypothetical protein